MDKEITKLEDESAGKKSAGKNKLSKFKVKDKVMIKARGWEEEYPGIITKVCTRNRYDIKLDDTELEQRKWKLIHAKYIKLKTKDDENYMETRTHLIF